MEAGAQRRLGMRARAAGQRGAGDLGPRARLELTLVWEVGGYLCLQGGKTVLKKRNVFL